MERQLIKQYISSLGKIAKMFLQKGRKVYFKQNRVVHWGEGGFGDLIIEGTEKSEELFGECISEITFIQKLNKEILKGYIEIKESSLALINYE